MATLLVLRDGVFAAAQGQQVVHQAAVVALLQRVVGQQGLQVPYGLARRGCVGQALQHMSAPRGHALALSRQPVVELSGSLHVQAVGKRPAPPSECLLRLAPRDGRLEPMDIAVDAGVQREEVTFGPHAMGGA